MARPDPRAEGIALTLVVIGSLAFQMVFYDRWISGMDEGHVLQFAEIAARGGVLYRDATFYPLPGAFLFLAGLFKIFPASIWLARVVVTCEFSLFTTLLYLVMRRLSSQRSALALATALLAYRVWAFPHWQIYSYSTTALLVLLGCAWQLLRYIDRGTRRNLWLSGLLFGLGVFCKQDYGAAYLLAILIVGIVYVRTTPGRERLTVKTLALLFLGPAALVGAFSGLWFWHQGVLSDVIHFTVLGHVIGITTFDYTTAPSLLPILAQDPSLREAPGAAVYLPSILYVADAAFFYGSWLYKETALVDAAMKLFYYGPAALFALIAFGLWRRRFAFETPDRRSAAFAELLLCALGASQILLFFLNRPQDYLHLAVLYWPVPCLLTIELARLWHASGKHARVALALALGLVLTIASLYTLRLAVRLRTSNPTEISLQRGGIYVRPDEASVITKAVHYIHEHGSPSDAVAILPYFPVLHFLADRRSPHRSAYILWPVPEFPDRDQRVIRALESSGTDVLVYELNHFLEFPRVADYAPALFDYLVDHFEIDRILSDARMGLKLATARRVRNAASGREVLSGSLDGSELLVVSAAGEAHAIDSASRSLYLQRDRWPLRRVIALRPTSGGGRTLLRVPLSIRPGETLHTAAMIRPDVWGAFHPSWIQFRVAIREGGVERTYIEKRIDSQRNSSDRHWFEMDLDVSDFEGREVELELSTAAQNRSGERLEMGGFEEPRLLARRAPTTSRTQ